MQHVVTRAAVETVVAGIGAAQQENVVARATTEIVGTRPANNNVVAGAAGDCIIAQAAIDHGDAHQFGTRKIQRVAAARAGDDIVAAIANDLLDRRRAAEVVHAEGIVARTALQHVVTRAAVETVVAGVGAAQQEGVVSTATIEVIGTCTADDDVPAGTARNCIVPRTAVDQRNADKAARRIVQRVATRGARDARSDSQREIGRRAQASAIGGGHSKWERPGIGGPWRSVKLPGFGVECQPCRQATAIRERRRVTETVARI